MGVHMRIGDKIPEITSGIMGNMGLAKAGQKMSQLATKVKDIFMSIFSFKGVGSSKSTGAVIQANRQSIPPKNTQEATPPRPPSRGYSLSGSTTSSSISQAGIINTPEKISTFKDKVNEFLLDVRHIHDGVQTEDVRDILHTASKFDGQLTQIEDENPSFKGSFLAEHKNLSHLQNDCIEELKIRGEPNE